MGEGSQGGRQSVSHIGEEGQSVRREGTECEEGGREGDRV